MTYLWVAICVSAYFVVGLGWSFFVHVAMRIVAATEGVTFTDQRARKAFFANFFLWPYSATVILTSIFCDVIIKLADRVAQKVAVAIRKKDTHAP